MPQQRTFAERKATIKATIRHGKHQMNPAKQDVPAETSHYRLDVSALLNLELPQECLAGIEANIELMRIHARKVEAFEIPEKSSEAESA
jgi:hypothetical protein